MWLRESHSKWTSPTCCSRFARFWLFLLFVFFQNRVQCSWLCSFLNAPKYQPTTRLVPPIVVATNSNHCIHVDCSTQRYVQHWHEELVNVLHAVKSLVRDTPRTKNNVWMNECLFAPTTFTFLWFWLITIKYMYKVVQQAGDSSKFSKKLFLQCSFMMGKWNNYFACTFYSFGTQGNWTPQSMSNFPCSLTRNVPSHVTVWRNWLLIAYLDERWSYYQFSLHHSLVFLFIWLGHRLPKLWVCFPQCSISWVHLNSGQILPKWSQKAPSWTWDTDKTVHCIEGSFYSWKSLLGNRGISTYSLLLSQPPLRCAHEILYQRKHTQSLGCLWLGGIIMYLLNLGERVNVRSEISKLLFGNTSYFQVWSECNLTRLHWTHKHGAWWL